MDSDEAYKIHADVVTNVGLYGLKALITINAGAVLAVISIFPHVAEGSLLQVDFDKIKYALGCFLFGMGCAFISLILTVISAQLSCAGHKNTWWQVFLTIIPGVASFSFFAAGGFSSIDAIQLVKT